MGAIITWINATARYAELDKLPNGTLGAVQDELIALAEAQVHSRLASRYSTPFSSSNLTARDLAIDTLFVQNVMAREPKKAEIVSKSLDDRYKSLLSGEATMVVSSGTALTMVGETAWSSTEDYHPVFGMGDIAAMAVSSSQLIDEDADRGGSGVAI